MWLQASLAELPFLEVVCFASSPLGFAQTYVVFFEQGRKLRNLFFFIFKVSLFALSQI